MNHPLNKLKEFEIILASKSPRRKRLLQNLDLEFEVQVRTVDETIPKNIPLQKSAEYLANLKASAFPRQFIPDNQLIITADTVVICDKKLLEKPQTKEKAIEMLNNLSNKKHKVITAVCIKTNSYEKTISAKSDVEFNDLSPSEIIYYIEKYKPYDKAGAYGIQEWIGLIGIKNINGSFYNVMGLPTHMLYDELKKFCDEQKS